MTRKIIDMTKDPRGGQFEYFRTMTDPWAVITALASLSREDMVRILKEPKNALTKQYQALMQFDNVELEFEDEALGKIADKAIAMEIGARGLRSVMEGVMTDLMYSVPSDPTIAKITITAASVDGTEPPRIERREQ